MAKKIVVRVMDCKHLHADALAAAEKALEAFESSTAGQALHDMLDAFTGLDGIDEEYLKFARAFVEIVIIRSREWTEATKGVDTGYPIVFFSKH